MYHRLLIQMSKRIQIFLMFFLSLSLILLYKPLIYFSFFYYKLDNLQSSWKLFPAVSHLDWLPFEVCQSREIYISPEKNNISIKFLWIQVVADFLHNSLLLTGHLNFLTWSSAIYKFYQPHVYTDHSMSFTYIVKDFLKLQKAFKRLRLSRS